MIIDIHSHAFPEKIVKRAMSSLCTASRIKPETNGTVESLISAMDKDGIDMAAVCNIATNPNQNENVNLFAIETKEKYASRLFPLGSLHPLYPEKEKEIKILKNSGIRGIKIHPDYMGFSLDDPAFDEIFELAASYDMFVITHAGFDVYSPDKVYANPDSVLRRISRSPKTKFICAHLGGNMMWKEVEEKLIGHDIYIDTSLSTSFGVSPEQVHRIIKKHDPEKILFGSDCPWASPRKTAELIDSLPLTDDLKEKIFEKNARTLLQI